MSYKFDPDNEDHWPELQDVVHEFMRLGCERHPKTWQDHASLDTAWDRRYRVINPESGGFIVILFPENEPVAPDMIANWERALDFIIDKPWEREPAIKRGPWSPPIN